MSLGFCRENFDLNKNSILENKKRDYYVLDIFDGETYSSSFPGQFMKYIEPSNTCKSGDIIGSQIDLDQGTIQYYKNGQPLGVAI